MIPKFIFCVLLAISIFQHGLVDAVHPKSNGCGCSYQYATGPSDGPTQGARRLAKYFESLYRVHQPSQIYNPRKIPGSNSWSLHAEGRAVDVFLTGATGQKAFNHAVSIACRTGIQEVIFNRRIWTNGRGNHAYHGSNPHTDHVHIGLNRCGAQKFDFN